MTAKGSIYKSAAAEKTVLDRYRAYLARWPVPNAELHIPTREGETFVVASGPKDAPPVVLLHGTMANSAMWMRDIVKWAKEFRVYAVDIVGDAGLSAPSRPPMASDAHALWLADVLDGLELPKASFVGVSLGGGLALDFAIRHPDRVESLVVLTPAGVADKNLLAWPLPLLLLGAWGVRKVRERIIGPVPENMPEQVAEFVEFMQAIFKGMRPRMERIPRFSDDQLGRLTMPVFVLLGGQDIAMDSNTIERRIEQHVADAKILLFAHAPHYLGDQSQPILEFLRHAARALPRVAEEPARVNARP